MNGRYYMDITHRLVNYATLKAMTGLHGDKDIKRYLYYRQAEEIAAHHAEQITEDYILGPALAAQAKPSQKPIAPRLP